MALELPSGVRASGVGAAVSLRGVSRTYGALTVLRSLDLDLAPGSFVGLVGKSGCGKSTLLRLLAGLEAPDSGGITVDGAPLSGRNPRVRVMFQEARLLPWKRVRDNVALGLSGPQARERANLLLAQVGLGDRGGDWPGVLSGGQRQRVALARALAGEPDLLLLDEPLGALDALTRVEMQRLIESIWQLRPVTTLLVTHDVEEAVALCDRVLLLEGGQVAAEVPVPLPRPRPRASAGFTVLKEELLDRLLARSPSYEI